jgi:HTH-type transcriptional regulator/antitoxin HipB
VDYPVQLASQLQQLLKSLRKSRQMTQAELARRLGVVQSRVADIERDPGAVSVEQLLQVLAMLGAQMVVRETSAAATTNKPSIELRAHARAQSSATAELSVERQPTEPTPDSPSDSSPPDEPRGQW